MIDVDLLESRVLKKLYGHLGKYSSLIENIDASDDYVKAMTGTVSGLTQCLREFNKIVGSLEENKFSQKAFSDIKKEIHLLRNAILEFDLRYVKILRTRGRFFLNPQEIDRLYGELSPFWSDLAQEIDKTHSRIRDLIDRAEFTQADKEPGYAELHQFMKEILSLDVSKIRSKFINNQSSLDGLFDPFDEEEDYE